MTRQGRPAPDGFPDTLCPGTRQIGLSVESADDAWTPSVFSLIPKLVEQAGTSDEDRSAFYTVLVKAMMSSMIRLRIRPVDTWTGTSFSPVTSRCETTIRPSISRAPSRVPWSTSSMRHTAERQQGQEMIKVYRDAEDLINIGAYARGSNPKIDQAISLQETINKWLQQGIFESSTIENASKELDMIFSAPGRGARLVPGKGRGGR